VIDERPSGRIFISYRRSDAQHIAGRLFDRLETRFGSGNVFMDVDSIEPGMDYGEAIDEAVSSCDVLLAVIGSKWINAVDEHNRRRLDDPDDLVVLEIATALQRDVRVIPVLVDGAPPPRRDDLPGALAPLARRHAVRLDHTLFNPAVADLLAALDRALGPDRSQRYPQTEPKTDHAARSDSGVRRVVRVQATKASTSPRSHPEDGSTTSPEFVLRLKKEGITAKAREINGAFVVLEGSLARHSWVGTDSHNYKKLRESLERDGTLAAAGAGRLMCFAHDQIFASPSAAAAVVVGRASNGREAWRTTDHGLTYDDWQSGAVSQNDLFS
jgi:hypothetical protein